MKKHWWKVEMFGPDGESCGYIIVHEKEPCDAIKRTLPDFLREATTKGWTTEKDLERCTLVVKLTGVISFNQYHEERWVSENVFQEISIAWSIRYYLPDE